MSTSTQQRIEEVVIEDDFDFAEHHEPIEGNAQVPGWMLLTFLAMAMWGGWYIGEFDGDFRASAYDGPDAFKNVDMAGGTAKSEPIDPVKLGKRVFNTCITCHQADGEGIAGKYPPLNKSEWVQKDDRILARILLRGMQGKIEVRGEIYNNQMPAWKQLSDYDIAAVLTHIRQSWDNDSPAVAPSTITAVREEIAEQTQPFDPAELLKLELMSVEPIGEELIALEYENAGDVATMAEIDEDKWIKNLKETYVLEKTETLTGDPLIGGSLFISATCITCHVDSDSQKAIAPSLNGVTQRLKRDEIIDSILHPSNKIAEGYAAYKFLHYEGQVYVGSILEETEEKVRIKQKTGEVIELFLDDIDDRMKDESSPMPEGLVDVLTIQQFADLLAYLESLLPDPNAKKPETDPNGQTEPTEGSETKDSESNGDNNTSQGE